MNNTLKCLYITHKANLPHGNFAVNKNIKPCILLSITKIPPQRKLIVSMNVSLDGFLSGPNCELDWHFNFWSIEMAEFLCDELKKADTILFGRITYNAMASYWPSKRIDLTLPLEDRAFAEMINSYTKIVFSHTLTQASWNNSFVVKENPADYIMRLKQSHGRPVMVYGSGRLVGYLIAEGLVDEFHIWVHPVMLGRGKPLFKKNMIQHLRLERTQKFRNGVVTFCYSIK